MINLFSILMTNSIYDCNELIFRSLFRSHDASQQIHCWTDGIPPPRKEQPVMS